MIVDLHGDVLMIRIVLKNERYGMERGRLTKYFLCKSKINF